MPEVRLNWEYGLSYNPDREVGSKTQLELKKSVALGRYIVALNEKSTFIKIYDRQLRPIFSWRTKQIIIDIFLADNMHLCILTAERILLVNTCFRTINILDLPVGVVPILGCPFETGHIALVHDGGILAINTQSGVSARLAVASMAFKQVTGIDYHREKKVFGVTHAADNVAFLVSPHGERATKVLGGGFSEGSTQLILHSPRGGYFRGDEFWVADANNNRLTCFNLTHGKITQVSMLRARYDARRIDALWRPTSVCSVDNNGLLICDSKNRRLLIVEPDGELRHMSSAPVVLERKLNLPRGLTVIGDKLLIADSHNNRLLELNIKDGVEVATVDGEIPWPRQVVDIAGARYVVSALLPYIPRLPGGAASASTSAATDEIAAGYALADPHQLVVDPIHGCIVVDSGNAQILVFKQPTDAGIIISEVNNVPFGDPHSADFTYEGGVAIADTRNNRLLFSDKTLRRWSVLREVHTALRRFTIRQPRFITKERDGRYLFIDTGSRSVYCIDVTGFVFWSVGSPEDLSDAILGSYYFWQDTLFHDPRWVISPREGLLIVADTGNSRIVSLSLHAHSIS